MLVVKIGQNGVSISLILVEIFRILADHKVLILTHADLYVPQSWDKDETASFLESIVGQNGQI